VAIFRVYTGDDGHSHVEELALDSPLLAGAFPATEMRFNEVRTGYSADDWHTAPARLVLFLIDGQIELGFRDGPQLFNPGDAVVIEDTTGTGHTIRMPGATPPTTAVTYLDD
jgi:hypothetical protein